MPIRTLDGNGAIVRVVYDILHHFDAGSIVALVSVDISTAFDMVNLRTLLVRQDTELEVRGLAFHWIGSYLEGRSLTVRICSSILLSIQ